MTLWRSKGERSMSNQTFIFGKVVALPIVFADRLNIVYFCQHVAVNTVVVPALFSCQENIWVALRCAVEGFKGAGAVTSASPARAAVTQPRPCAEPS